MNISELLDRLRVSIWEMSVKTEFDFKPAKMDYKAKELYKNVYVDNIAPYYFAVIRESKYSDGLPELRDKYRASLEYQSFAYSVKDYSLNKAHLLNGTVSNFSDYSQALKWLKAQLKDNFVFALKESRQSND